MLTRSTPFLAALLVWAPTVWAQDLGELERNLQAMAKSSIPKTVLIQAVVNGDQSGAGSGAIISSDGYILTCSHVVEISKTLKITTPDGKVFDGTLLGRSKRQDYALVKIDAKGLPAFTMGDSSKVKPGDWVMALGHPGGPYADKQPAFAAGRVLDLDRKLPVGMMSKYYNHAIMTDVPIFAGDSGGPLIDMQGNLIGINGAIVMINELAFAIPMNQIAADLDRLKAGEVIEGEKPSREAMAEMQKLISPEDRQKMMSRAMKNMQKAFGDSPLSKLFGEDSPLGDMFGGENGEMPDLSKLFGGNGEMPDLGEMFGGEGGDMQKMLEDLMGGEGGDLQEMLKGLMNGENGDMQKMLEDLMGGNGEMPDLGELFGGGNGEMPDLGELFGGGKNRERADPPPAADAARPFVGIKIAPTGEQKIGGLLVEASMPDGPAAKAGIKKGDVVVSIGGHATPDTDALRKALKGKRPGQTLEVKVQRTTLIDTVQVEETVKLQLTLGAR